MSANTATKPVAGAAPKNRRIHQRLEVSEKLIARCNGELMELPLANISYSGAYFDYPNPKRLSVGTPMELDLLRGEEAATTKAKIVHSTGDGFAVVFVEPPLDFTTAVSRMLTRRLMADANPGAEGFDVTTRIAMLLQQGPEFEVLFTTGVGEHGVLVLTDRLWAYSETLWITLLEHGMFDCEVRVIWCTEDGMALEFINPSDEFQAAYRRVLDAFLG